LLEEAARASMQALNQTAMGRFPVNMVVTTLDATPPDVETSEQAASHDAWFRAKVLEALNSTQDYLPHKVAMADVDRMLAEKRARHAAG